MKRYKFLFVFILMVTIILCIGYTRHMLSVGWSLIRLPKHGTQLGRFEGWPIYSANGANHRGKYGLEFQCVELINRAYGQMGHRNMTKTGHADSYFWNAKTKGLIAYPNGSSVSPQKYDILIFDGGDNDGSVGHVALITKVDLLQGYISIVQQNIVSTRYLVFKRYIWSDRLNINNINNTYFVERGSYLQPIAGWSRPQEKEE